MRVKRLEIQGFKSFKDKTVIHFDHAITGIVGPNGCGKSNIVDAFFWVMGEQSYKHMRGSSSEDLIFNGSSKYSPLGLAEATMVLETDADDVDSPLAGPDAPAGASTRDIPVHLRSKEIAVTRRVHRSGEGEYFINGVPARLRDIQELFMDTGVGAKGYSVIEQGQIGKIVNAKPEDRRLLIEEAAGIAKYKKRKQESLRKMEATQLNLSRLNDVIQEIERGLASLDRQAQKARLYKKYKDELIDKEMTWGRRKVLVLKQKAEALKKQRDAMEQELLAMKTELQTTENAMETDRVAQLTDTKIAEDLQARIQGLSENLAREQSALELSRKRQGDLASQVHAFESEKSDLETLITQATESLTQKSGESQDSQLSFQAAAEKAQSTDEATRALRKETESARRDLEDLKRTLMTDIAQSSDLHSRAAALLSRAESAEGQAQKLRAQAETQLAKVAQARDEAARAQATSQAVREKISIIQAERKSQAESVESLEQRNREAERARDESSRKATQLRSRLQSLEELAQAHEGYSDGPKAILDWSRESGESSHLAALADAYVVAPGFDAALEGWMEGRLEALVASNADTALASLSRLKAEGKGRAAILLNTGIGRLRTTATASYDQVRSALTAAGFQVEGELKKYVSVNAHLGEPGTQVAMALVEGVCVVSTFAPMSAFLASGGLSRLSGWSIASREGVALDATGVLRGGSTESDNVASLLGRKRAITDLQAQVSDVESALQAAEAAHSEAKQALDLSRARLQTLQVEIQSLEVQSAALERDVHQSARGLKDAESQAELLALETAQMEEEATRAKAERAAIEEQVLKITSRRAELEAQVASSEATVFQRETDARARESELQSLRVNEAELRERCTGTAREVEAARALIADRERRLSDVLRGLDRTTREKEQFTGGDGALEIQITELVHGLAGSRESLAAVKDRLELTSAQINAGLENIKTLHHSGDDKTTQVNQLALEAEKISGDLSHLVQNLEEKYGPGCLERPVVDSVATPIQEEMSEPVITAEMTADEEQTLGEDVERLRDRIRRLGEVNVMAIDEYEELKKRYDHLVAERTDLEQSITNLEAAIEHINKTSVERFRRAFEAIADRFERLFPIIFGGGQAKLSLVYPEGTPEGGGDILEAGVDILAQPPGKKIVNIQLLSGGEKALTAVSLIFAIFMVKPSPFCVLDEVDAPLDDANIGKFNALLKEMSAKSQFIIITHNKKTMELNDTLYGVTMEEPGVSKMVSIEMH